jgi:uncharacterized membrane protein
MAGVKMNIKVFLKTSLLGGVVVILPVALLVFIARWLVELVAQGLQPLIRLLDPDSTLQLYAANGLAILVLVGTCFAVGVLVRTRLGGWIYSILEERLLKRAPGYSLLKDTVKQFIGNETSPFSSVALVRIFGNETRVSAFITDTHPDGSYTVFVPTGPNPTSGNIYHLKAEFVEPIDVPIEDTMRSIISCGAGSTLLIEASEKE